MIESKGVLILEKKDLARESRGKDVEDIHITDIAGSFDPIRRATMVIIVDEGKMKILKSKYPLEGDH